MSYFVVPSVSYQTKQKLEKQQKDKERKAKRKKKHGSSGSESTRSSTGSKHSHENTGDTADNDDARSIMTANTLLSRHSSHGEPTKLSTSLKPLTQLREDQNEQGSPKQEPLQLEQQTNNLSPKSKEIIKSPPQEFVQLPDFNQSAQNQPVEQQLPRENDIEINEQASMIASRYGDALRSGSTKSPSTPTVNPFSKSPPAGRRSSGSLMSSTSAPSLHLHHLSQNQGFQRNTSISSGLSQTSQNSGPSSLKDNLTSNQKFRKLSFLGTSGKRRGSLASLPGAAGSPTSKLENSYFPEYGSGTVSPSPVASPHANSTGASTTSASTSNSHSNSNASVELSPFKVLPPFNTNIDLSVYNNRQAVERNFVAPNYQVFRYNSFLDLLSEYHSGDAINISSIRYHLLLKFISKQKNAKDFISKGNTLSAANSYSLTMADSVLAYHLYGPMRGVLRELIRIRANNPDLFNHEELVQCNFINFVRYVTTLPENANTKEMTDLEKRIYKFKDIFSRTAHAIYILKKEQPGESSSEEIAQLRVKLLIETITKVCYEYLLLEKYRLDITTKYHNNHLIDMRLLKKLFYKYEANVKARNRENVKVFLYNTSNLIQYSWYLSLTIPCIRVIESHVYTEDKNLINDLDKYRKVELATPKIDFSLSDHELYETYTRKLSFSSFAEFKNMTMDKLVKLHRSIDNQSPQYSRINRHEMPDPANNFSFKPMNFEYYNFSMSTIPNETFDLVLTPDLVLQASNKSYKTIISEFYRILKPGGTLNIDSLQFGAKNTKDFIKRYQESGGFPTTLDGEDMGVLEFFDGMPNFTETILREIASVFGKGNVQFSISLLSSVLDVNSFTIKFVGMRLFEILGRFDDYCDSFTEVGEIFKNDANESIHFSIHIRALKSV